MKSKSIIFKQKNHFYNDRLSLSTKGFTLIEVLVVIGIIGIFIAAIYPSILNSLETRRIENEARDVLATLQRAKYQAVKSKLNHRVRFFQDNNNKWYFILEEENFVNVGGVATSKWETVHGFVIKSVSSNFEVTMNLPNTGTAEPGKAVAFSPLGFITNFTLNQNTITLKSEKLERYNQPDLRIISIFAGGSIKYTKAEG